MASGPVTLDFSRALPITPAEPDQVTRLRQSVSYGVTQNPDAYAQQLSLQKQTGLPPELQADPKTLQQATDAQSLDYAQMVDRTPRTANWASHPDNAAVAGVDEIQRLGRIEQHAATMSAYTPTWWDRVKGAVSSATEALTGSSPERLKQNVFEYPLTRGAIDLAGGAAGLVGDVASFAGWHGGGNDKRNLLQHIEAGLSPEANLPAGNVFANQNEFDWVAKNVAPMLPLMLTGIGESALAERLGLSHGAMRVLSGLTAGALFTAQAGGEAYTQLANEGASPYSARLAANRVAAISALPNALFGFADRIPGLSGNPLLASVALGGVQGSASQIGQNVAVTKKPWSTDVAKSAMQGAAMQGGMHMGMGFLDNFGAAVEESQASQLKERSPEAFEQAATHVFDGAESLRIPAEQFATYFQSKNMDPAEVAADLGATNYAEARLSGGDVEVRPERYLARLAPEHQNALLPDVVDPAIGMSRREAQNAGAELEEFVRSGGVERIAGEFAAADAETQASPEWQAVKEQLTKQYVDAGETVDRADQYAALQANVYANFARETGMTPTELLALHAPAVRAGEAPEASLAQAPLAMDDNGEYHFGQLPDEAVSAIGRPAAEIRLREGDAKQGHQHIDTQHAEQIAAKGFSSAQDFVRYVAQNFDAIYARPRDPNGLDLVVNHDPRGRMIVSLEYDADGHFYDVKTAHPVRADQYKNKKPLWERTGPSPSSAEADPLSPGARAANESVAPSSAGVKPGETLYQARKAGKKLNLKMAQIQGEMLKGSGEPTASAPEQPRGWFRALPDGTFEIGKTKIGDLSTFIHEPAQSYLELFRELTQRDGASDALKSDFAKVAEWLGTTPEEAHKNGFTREQHEHWARANEQYVREGKAPTSGLQRAFHNFSVWLGKIYRRASSLGVELSDDIRGVMDRMYGADESVGQAKQEAGQPLVKDAAGAAELGWSEAEYRKYAEDNNAAVEDAKAAVQKQLNEAAERFDAADRRQELRDVREAVTQEVDNRPEYAAIRSLRRGTTDLGTDLTLNRDALVKQFGEERVKALQKVHRGLYRLEGGTDPETAAEILGFDSADQMMRTLTETPRRSKMIEQATREHLVNKYGDVRYDGTLLDKARFAVENDKRSGNLYRELVALKKKVAGLEKKASDAKEAMRAISIAPIEAYQKAAREMVSQKAPADIQPHRYLDASRKYSREAFDALRKGNASGAADAKHKELLNHFLFREATEARNYLDKFEKYVDQAVKSKGIQQRLALAGSDFRDQFNWLLARYGLGPSPEQGQYTAPERSLRAWADEQYDSGAEPVASGVLDDVRYRNYRNVPLQEIRDLHDALVNIRTLARQQFEIYVQGKKVEFANAKQAMIEAARTNLKVKPEQVFEENRSLGTKIARGLQWADSRLIRMERLIEWLDGGKAGPWHDHLWNLASDAQGDEYKLQELVTRQVTDALADMPTEMRKRLWTEKLTVEGIPEPLPRRRLLSMAFNMGNEGNLDRLRKTFIHNGWDPEAIQRIGGMLTREEWNFVQRSWESLKPLGERMQELERRLTGLPPQMVKVTPLKIELDGGDKLELPGGYFPIAMDPRFSQRAIEQDSKETAQNAMQAGYVRATTAKGYTKARTGFGGPLLLDYEHVLTSHVSKVAKDLSHREFMLASQRLLLDTEVRKTLRETLGSAYEQQFMPWLRTIINDNNGSVQEHLDGLKEGMQKLRGNIVAASLGFNASTSLLQISHAPRMLLYARPSSLAQAFVDLLAHPADTSREIKDLSPNEMRFRGDNLDRDIRAVLLQPDYRAGYTRKVAVAARFALEMMDHLLSHTLWKAAYRDALEKYVDLPMEQAQRKAAHEADSAVRLGLGTSAPKDLPAIMRSNEFNKFITTLYGFHNGVYNQLRDIGHQFRYDRNLGKATVAGILTVMLPAVMGNWLTGRGPGEDERSGWWAAKKSLIFAADTIPIVRSIASAMEGGHDVQFSPIESVMQKGGKALADASADKDDKDWLGIGLNAADALGATLGVPGSHQIVKTLRYTKRVSAGKVQNPNLWNAVVGGGR